MTDVRTHLGISDRHPAFTIEYRQSISHEIEQPAASPRPHTRTKLLARWHQVLGTQSDSEKEGQVSDSSGVTD